MRMGRKYLFVDQKILVSVNDRNGVKYSAIYNENILL